MEEFFDIEIYFYKLRREIRMQDLAKKLGISRVYLCKVIHGHVKPSLSLAKLLSASTKSKIPPEAFLNYHLDKQKFLAKK